MESNELTLLSTGTAIIWEANSFLDTSIYPICISRVSILWCLYVRSSQERMAVQVRSPSSYDGWTTWRSTSQLPGSWLLPWRIQQWTIHWGWIYILPSHRRLVLPLYPITHSFVRDIDSRYTMNLRRTLSKNSTTWPSHVSPVLIGLGVKRIVSFNLPVSIYSTAVSNANAASRNGDWIVVPYCDPSSNSSHVPRCIRSQRL